MTWSTPLLAGIVAITLSGCIASNPSAVNAGMSDQRIAREIEERVPATTNWDDTVNAVVNLVAWPVYRSRYYNLDFDMCLVVADEQSRLISLPVAKPFGLMPLMGWANFDVTRFADITFDEYGRVSSVSMRLNKNGDEWGKWPSVSDLSNTDARQLYRRGHIRGDSDAFEVLGGWPRSEDPCDDVSTQGAVTFYSFGELALNQIDAVIADARPGEFVSIESAYVIDLPSDVVSVTMPLSGRPPYQTSSLPHAATICSVQYRCENPQQRLIVSRQTEDRKVLESTFLDPEAEANP